MASATSKFLRPKVSWLALPELKSEMKAIAKAYTKRPGDVEDKTNTLVRDQAVGDLQSMTLAALEPLVALMEASEPLGAAQ